VRRGRCPRLLTQPPRDICTQLKAKGPRANGASFSFQPDKNIPGGGEAGGQRPPPRYFTITSGPITEVGSQVLRKGT